jgi:hypothetical protein
MKPDGTGRGENIMAKFFAVTIIIIAILSAIPILRHTWAAPEDISTHGHLIDAQMSETMAEAGISFLAAQFLLAIFVWKFSNPGPNAKLKNFPGGAKVLVIAALLVVGVEVLALGVFGVKAWADVYLTPPAADAMPIQEPSAPPTPTLLMRDRRISSASIPSMIRIHETTS